MQLLSFLLPTLLLAPSAVLSKKVPKDAILLSNVKTLTLRANGKTSHRRVSAVPQLTCKGPGCRHHHVEMMRCTNQGADYNQEDIQWSCTADVPEEFKLGSTDVQCEGYASRDDDYILKGSCGVEYRLLLTSKGEERYGNSFWGGNNKHSEPGEGSTFGGVLFMLLFFAVAAWIIYSIWETATGTRPRAARRPGGFFGGGWGGGGGGPDDPYDPPPPYPGKRYTTRADESWRPGFWSGAMGGAAAGYMAGNRGQRQQRDNGSWFGGGGNGNGGWQPSRSSSSGSSARHESTGFGSTSRR
ncbi:hypothetical protein BJ875DRAFT_12340 [Amylocarpus encephaloides]|uniref:Store-operated calcium entry-associated regulatory factor n=1 Tax=Amylocarpus encephaloides TaxID=45428 RepID=A0A9P7YIG7_9HELO|nr:hypothetical protein BJ875DRAFT_12340 [Amylocarpus encephaloides]